MHKLLCVVPALLLAAQIPALAQVDSVPPGTEVAVRVDEPVNIATWDRGRIYNGELASDVYTSGGQLAFPRGAPVELTVRQVSDRDMVLDLESINYNGRRYFVNATGQDYDTRGGRPGVGENRRTGRYVGGGAVVGSIIGAIVGGGKGAAIGAAAGAATGAGAQMATRGREIHIPVESVVTFRLDRPLDFYNGDDPGYYRGGHHYHPYR